LRPKVDGLKRPTGAGSRPRQIRASLKALGAYRLLLCYKGNRTKARSHKDVCKILGKDFYNNEAAWIGANHVALANRSMFRVTCLPVVDSQRATPDVAEPSAAKTCLSGWLQMLILHKAKNPLEKPVSRDYMNFIK
jgi:hypothetical protein